MTKLWPWAIAAVAFLIAVFTLIPAELWTHPAVDQQYSGFDPKLVYANNGDGSSAVTHDAVTLESRPDANPVVTLITTPMQRISVSLTATVADDQGASEPLRLGLWSPRTRVGYFVVFGAGPNHAITVEGITDGVVGTTLRDGKIVRQVTLGTYDVGAAYRIGLLVDRATGMVSYHVFAGKTQIGQDSVSPRDFPQLFVPLRVSVSAWSQGGSGSSRSVLTAYQLTMLHERFWTSEVADPKAAIIFALLAGASGLAIALVVWENSPKVARFVEQLRGTGTLDLQKIWPKALLVLAGVAFYLAGNAFLFQFAGHPFDMGGERVFAHVASAYGPTQLYFLPNLVPLASIWQGQPYIEAGYPYGPVHSYVFAGIGYANQLLFGSTGSDLQLEVLIKTVNVLFGLGDAALIYAISRRIGLSQRWSLIASAFFLFNPAVWFSMSVWGQTHVISVFFVLAAILLAEYGFAMWSWLALIAACLTRPQMLVFALLIGIVLLRKFDWRTNVIGLSWTIVLTFLLLLPITVASSPSLPVDFLINNFRIQEAGGNESSVTTVSQGAYSIWPLITLVNGNSGIDRIYAPSLASLIGPLSYQRTSQILTGGALAVVVALLLRRRREAVVAGGYIPIVAVGITSFVMLLTGIVSTHFLLALPFLLLCRRWLDPLPYLFVAVVWTITSLVPMFGDMGTILSSGNELLAPTYRPITEFMIGLYTWDRFITVGIVANICAVVMLGVAAFHGPAPARRATEIS